ncbi:26S proteasome non-ATPase regulatory subunit 10, partial [Stegodyphus mimosarum]
MLEIHHGRFPLNLYGSLLDKSSEGSQSGTQDVEILLRKSQTFLERLERRGSLSSEHEPPPIFANALHLAVECHSLDVARLLLKYGVDPNESGIPPSSFEIWRRGSCSAASNHFLSPCFFRLSASSKTYVCTRQCLDPSLRTVYVTPEGKNVFYDEHYTREALYVLAPLFLAVAVGNATMVHLLLKYGAFPKVQDKYGVTPLHLATCQHKVSWSCIRLLLERGAKIETPNKQGVCPYQLLDTDLRLLQKSLVEDAFSCFLAHPVARVEGEESFLSTGNSFRNYFLLKRFQDNKSSSHQSSKTKDTEEEVSHQESTHRSSLENSSHTEDELSDKTEYNDQRRCSSSKSKGTKGTHTPSSSEPSETRVTRAEVNLHVLTKMATNEECILPLLINFQLHLPAVIELTDHVNGQRLHKPVAAFLEQLLQTTMQNLLSTGDLRALCLLLRVAVGCLKGGQFLQYSGLLLINKVIDTCIIRTLPLEDRPMAQPLASSSDSCSSKDEPRVDGLSNIFSGTCVQLLLNALNNGITLHKRGVVARLHCTPS